MYEEYSEVYPGVNQEEYFDLYYEYPEVYQHSEVESQAQEELYSQVQRDPEV